ncbi:MAG: hypothetical protein WA908_12060 [Pontixanthobacter sp.]
MANRLSKGLVAGLCAIAALGAGAQGLSNVATKKNPSLAASLSPYASEPLEQIMLGNLRPEDSGDAIDTSDAVSPARQAFKREPLATEAAAILAMTLGTQDSRNSAIEAVNSLSRRGRAMNLAVLQNAVPRNDSERSIQVLNNAFLVYPNLAQQWLPSMRAYLADAQNIPAFHKVLQTDPAWADAFFESSNVSANVLVNLARLRITLDKSVALEHETERMLITRLAKANLWPEAFALHASLTGDASTEKSMTIDWQADYPPFDWEFADERRFYARSDAGGRALRVRITPGKGGLLAGRIVQVPTGARTLSLTHSLEPARGLENMTLSAACVGSEAEIASTKFRIQNATVSLADASCEWIAIAIVGRVFSTGSAIKGEIDRLEFKR